LGVAQTAEPLQKIEQDLARLKACIQAKTLKKSAQQADGVTATTRSKKPEETASTADTKALPETKSNIGEQVLPSDTPKVSKSNGLAASMWVQDRDPSPKKAASTAEFQTPPTINSSV